MYYNIASKQTKNKVIVLSGKAISITKNLTLKWNMVEKEKEALEFKDVPEEEMDLSWIKVLMFTCLVKGLCLLGGINQQGKD